MSVCLAGSLTLTPLLTTGTRCVWLPVPWLWTLSTATVGTRKVSMTLIFGCKPTQLGLAGRLPCHQPTEPSCGSGEVVPSKLGPGGGTTPARTASTTSAVSVGLPSPVRGICLPNARGFRICAIPCRSFMTCPLAGSLPNLGLRQNPVGSRLVPVLLTVTGCRLS